SPDLCVSSDSSQSIVESKCNLNNTLHLSHITVKKGFKIGCYNANGLRSRQDDIKDLISKVEFDVLSILETKLDDKVQSNRFWIDGYEIIRCDRPPRKANSQSCGGGSLIYYNSSRVTALQLFHKIEFPKECEVTILKIWLKYSSPLILITIYRRPVENEISHFLAAFEKLIESLSPLNLEFIIMGDINIQIQIQIQI